MHKIGIKQGKWLIITDGNEVFRAEEDVRYYPKPPRIKTKNNDEQYIEGGGEANRIDKITLPQSEFVFHCVSQGMEVRGCVTTGEKAKKIFGPATIGGIVGAVVGGPIGAAVGAGITGWFASGSDFNQENISSAFERAQAHYKEWKTFDEQQRTVDREQQKKYRTKAENKWRRFYKLRNLSTLDTLDGFEFEAAIAGLYESKGYSIEITKASGDYGVDVLAKKGKEILAIQAKRYSGKVGVKAVQEVSSGAFYYKASKAIVITNSFYTEQAKKLANNIGVTLINKKRLANMWESYHPSAEMPPFELQKYEHIKKDIDRELYRVDVAAGRKYNKRYMR